MTKSFSDRRGKFLQVLMEEIWNAVGLGVGQVNVSTMVEEGTLKGVHWQTGAFAEYRQVTCLGGRVYDVAVDIRPESPTFLQWQGVELAALDGQSVLIPPGFGHAIQALTRNCIVHYIHSSTYEPTHEAGLNALDSTLGISWPLIPSVMSERDRSLPTAQQLFGCGPSTT